LSYVRSKRIRGYGPYFYEQEGHRGADGKVHTKHIRYLGKNPHLGQNPGGQSSSAKQHDANGPTTPQEAGPVADQPPPPSHDGQEARGEEGRPTKEALAKNEAESNIIDDTDAPKAKKEQVKRKRTSGLGIQIGGF
jgi:hypothetical protein